MNVERGRERNTDSKEGAEECSLQVQALGGIGTVLKIRAVARLDKDPFHMLSALGSILKIPTRGVNQG